MQNLEEPHSKVQKPEPGTRHTTALMKWTSHQKPPSHQRSTHHIRSPLHIRGSSITSGIPHHIRPPPLIIRIQHSHQRPSIMPKVPPIHQSPPSHCCCNYTSKDPIHQPPSHQSPPNTSEVPLYMTAPHSIRVAHKHELHSITLLLQLYIRGPLYISPPSHESPTSHQNCPYTWPPHHMKVPL